MPGAAGNQFRSIDLEAALRRILEGTAAATGEGFFRALVRSLASALDTHGAWVTEYLPERRRLRALAFWLGGEWVEDYEHCIDGTPCEHVVEGQRLIHVPDNLMQLYPLDADARSLGAVSYLGVPLTDREGRVLGHLAVLDRKPIPPDERMLGVFRVFAERAAAEHQRLAAEARLRQREQKLAHLINSAMDAILDLDAAGRVVVANLAAERLFRCPAPTLVGKQLSDLVTSDGHRRLMDLAQQLKAQDGGGLWVPGVLEARRCDGEVFAAEATLSRYELRGSPCHTVILRDVGERLEWQRQIRSLTAQTEYLRDELRELHHSDAILGQSPAMRHVTRDIGQVAPTDASVLILGETGTGKELVARAIHAQSRRRDKPLIRVNCAAIPANLMESEFFGHEKGAFTGATQRRQGRFALADGGTLFLDEVGELPVDLQVKLLRALQEGEFEPVGCNRTVKVDVRLIAATNRDLHEAIRAGRFREDLYYRLSVFPIHVPPLRDRGDDVGLLARAFAARAAHRIGKRVRQPDEACLQRLRAYGWPGNVRELENVVERAVITSPDGRLNLDRALPEAASAGGSDAERASPPAEAPTVKTAAEIEQLERRNMLRALAASGWRIAGPGGAAAMLGMKPSTLRSRMKALDIRPVRSGQ